tara:strand:+ start:1843 stop:2436 length:594 start_codon:yes stop_codon:yes gene_type:complete
MIIKFFPVLIGSYINPKHKDIEKSIVEWCFELKELVKSGGENWLSKSTYNTIGKYDVWADKEFSDINKFVLESVKNYCKELLIQEDSFDENTNDAWFNIYKKGDYQEYHNHGDSLFSAVYFLKTPENSAKIYFKSPIMDMIRPNYTEYTIDTYERINFTPQAGMLLIFRSFLEHSVEQQEDDDARISIAYNFKKKRK